MSRVLPNAMVVRAFRDLGLPEDRLPEDLEEIVNQGLQKLYGFQHQDGSWGWWYDDDGNLYQTTYVIYGLVMTQQAGYAVDEGVLTRGITATKTLLTVATDLRTQSYALYVLSTAGEGDLAAAQALLGEKDQLDYFSQAALALALSHEGDTGGANELIDDLVAAAVETPSTAHWPQSDLDGVYGRKAMASTTRATALVLEALVQVRPDSPLLPKAALWLMNKRIGGHWRTTQETAYAILALSDYIQVSGELEPDYSYQVYLNGQLLSDGVITAANALEPIPQIVVPYNLLADGDNHVYIVKHGTGQLYYVITLHASHLRDGFAAVQPAGSGISVTRWYEQIGASDDDSASVAWAVNDLIKVHLSIDAADDAWYVIIDDPLPAGCEALNERLNTTSYPAGGAGVFWWNIYGYNRKDVHDERVTLFVTHLPAGRREYDYLMRATTPGEFSVLPAKVYLMYDPDTWARSASLRFHIGPAPDTGEKEVTPPVWLTGDFDRDCQVTDFDLKQVVAPWNTRAGEAGYDAARDLDRDGDMDVMDIVRVAINWGDVCSLRPPPLIVLQELYPTARIEPADLTVATGDTFTVAVRLDEAEPPNDPYLPLLRGYQFDLRFDPTLIRVDSVAMHPGYSTLTPHIDAISGQMTCGAFRYGEGEGMDTGTSLQAQDKSLQRTQEVALATITLTALGDGYANFTLDTVQAAKIGSPRQVYLPLVFRTTYFRLK